MKENENQQKKTVENNKWSQNGASTTRSRAHLSYWETVVFQREGGNWYVQIRHAGRRMKLSLGTPVKTAAVARARDFYLTLLDEGWDKALLTLRPATAPRSTSTVGEFIAELKAKADVAPKTLEGYCVAFRKIVADSFGIDGGKAKFDYRSGGRQKWIERVHAIKLADVTTDVVQRWKRVFLDRAGDDPIRLRSAKISVNSFLRRAKSLFAPAVIRHISIPIKSPFEGVRFEPRQSMRYRSTIDVEELTKAAQDELASDSPAFLAFLLALGAGLRRKEIDRLEWPSILWDQNAIRIEPTQFFNVKSEHSIDDVPVDSELMTILRGYHAKARSNFVIESPNLPRQRVTFENYRAQAVFERLSEWLRRKGVTDRKPVHALRKEAGSLVNRRYGLVAAQTFLRHADIGITAAHYIDLPRQATSGLGSLLKAAQDKKIVPLSESTAPDSSDKVSNPKSA